MSDKRKECFELLDKLTEEQVEYILRYCELMFTAPAESNTYTYICVYTYTYTQGVFKNGNYKRYFTKRWHR